MKAWRLHEKEKLSLDELPAQSVGDGCVKLKTLASGISLTDTAMYTGKLPLESSPLIIGRQCVGMVTATGEGVSGLVRGDRVPADPCVCCKTCPPCKANRADECEKMICYGVNDNGFLSDFTVASANALYKLPERITDGDALFIEHIALSINAVSKLNLEKGEHIVIVGADALGIILAQVALYYQAVPILVDTDGESLALAENLGVYYTVNSVDADTMKKIFAITGGKMADCVAFVTTSRMAFGRSLEYASVGGRVALAGWTEVTEEFSGSFSAILDKKLKVVGVNNGAKLFPAAINLLATRTVDVSKLVSREVKFDDVENFIKEQADNADGFILAAVKA